MCDTVANKQGHLKGNGKKHHKGKKQDSDGGKEVQGDGKDAQGNVKEGHDGEEGQEDGMEDQDDGKESQVNEETTKPTSSTIPPPTDSQIDGLHLDPNDLDHSMLEGKDEGVTWTQRATKGKDANHSKHSHSESPNEDSKDDDKHDQYKPPANNPNNPNSDSDSGLDLGALAASTSTPCQSQDILQANDSHHGALVVQTTLKLTTSNKKTTSKAVTGKAATRKAATSKVIAGQIATSKATGKATTADKMPTTETNIGKATVANPSGMKSIIAKPVPNKLSTAKGKGGTSATQTSTQPPCLAGNLKLTTPSTQTPTGSSTQTPIPSSSSSKRSAQGPPVGQAAAKQKKQKTWQADMNRNDSWGKDLNQELQDLRVAAAAQKGKKRERAADKPAASSSRLPTSDPMSTTQVRKRPAVKPVPPPDESILAAANLASEPLVATRAAKAELINEIQGGEGSKTAPIRRSKGNKRSAA